MQQYEIRYSNRFCKEFKKLDTISKKLVLNFIEKNLINSINPRCLGKALKGKLTLYWRYRIGNYRIIVFIDDNQFIINAISVGHRKDIYSKQI